MSRIDWGVPGSNLGMCEPSPHIGCNCMQSVREFKCMNTLLACELNIHVHNEEDAEDKSAQLLCSIILLGRCATLPYDMALTACAIGLSHTAVD